MSRYALPRAIGIMTGYGDDDPRLAIGCGISAACCVGRSEAQVAQDVMAALWADVLSDLGIIPEPSQPGRA